MSTIIRGTTPTLTFHVKNEQLNLNEIAEIWITFRTKSGVKIKDKTYDKEDVVIDAENHTIELFLSQEDTLSFTDPNTVLQLRVRFNNDLAYASNIMGVQIGHILKEGVI